MNDTLKNKRIISSLPVMLLSWFWKKKVHFCMKETPEAEPPLTAGFVFAK